MGPDKVVDISVKTVVAQVPAALFRLAGVDADPQAIHPADTAAIVRELHADDVYVYDAEAPQERWGLYAEYQYVPAPEDIPRWLQKALTLGETLGFPVLLLVVYLHRGRRASFPARLEIRRGTLRNCHEFSVIRLWEHAERIRSGELAELAPLLILCEDNPGIEVVREERALIEGASVSQEVRVELLAAAYLLGLKHMTSDILDKVFEKDLPDLRSTGTIGKWIREHEEEVRKEGREEGREEGRVANARAWLTHVISRRFGAIPTALAERIMNASEEECSVLLDRVLDAQRVEDLAD